MSSKLTTKQTNLTRRYITSYQLIPKRDDDVITGVGVCFMMAGRLDGRGWPCSSSLISFIAMENSNLSIFPSFPISASALKERKQPFSSKVVYSALIAITIPTEKLSWCIITEKHYFWLWILLCKHIYLWTRTF